MSLHHSIDGQLALVNVPATPTSDTERAAVLSECGRYRYVLTRTWDHDLAACAFIGLNPSTADAHEDDPTIRRCIRFARDWGHGGLIMLNLFAWRSTDPRGLLDAIFPVGPPADPRHVARRRQDPRDRRCYRQVQGLHRGDDRPHARRRVGHAPPLQPERCGMSFKHWIDGGSR
jgi:hypothetical protein